MDQTKPNGKIEMSTYENSVPGTVYMNPFFGDESLGANNKKNDDGNDNSNNKKRNALQRRASKKLIQKNNHSAKCTFSLTKQRNILFVSFVLLLLWIIFLILSITSLKTFIESSPIAYMFISFQFAFVLSILIE